MTNVVLSAMVTVVLASRVVCVGWKVWAVRTEVSWSPCTRGKISSRTKCCPMWSGFTVRDTPVLSVLLP